MILPALTEATSPFFRLIKYSLFPPLGLATLAGYLRYEDEVSIFDEHVERLHLDDDRPDLVVIQPYIASARRSYELADAYRARGAARITATSVTRTRSSLVDARFTPRPSTRRWPRSTGCPGGTCTSSTTSSETDAFPDALFAGMVGTGRVWQAAGTVDSVLAPGLLEQAVAAGLRSLFVGFETINGDNVPGQHKRQNIGRDYSAVVRRLHDVGVMVNASFVFGMDDDRPDVFDRTVSWAVEQGIETATFHIMTPYPGTALHARMVSQGRMLHRDWDLYDTRHVVFRPVGMTAGELEAGYWRAYRDFYRWSAIWRGAQTKPMLRDRLRHLAYAGGWKRFEPMWDLLIRTGQVLHALPVLESLLGSFGARQPVATKEAWPRLGSTQHRHVDVVA